MGFLKFGYKTSPNMEGKDSNEKQKDIRCRRMINDVAIFSVTRFDAKLLWLFWALNS